MQKLNQKLLCRRGTARRSVSGKILSNTAQLYEKSHFKTIAIDEWPWTSLKVMENCATR